MDQVEIRAEPELTIATAGQALLAQLEARGSTRSHRETVECHVRVHLVTFFRPGKGENQDQVLPGLAGAGG